MAIKLGSAFLALLVLGGCVAYGPGPYRAGPRYGYYERPSVVVVEPAPSYDYRPHRRRWYRD